jgi:carbon storage regulator CsrA
MLILTRRVGELILIGDEIQLKVITLETVCKGLGVRMWEVMKDAGD